LWAAAKLRRLHRPPAPGTRHDLAIARKLAPNLTFAAGGKKRQFLRPKQE